MSKKRIGPALEGYDDARDGSCAGRGSIPCPCLALDVMDRGWEGEGARLLLAGSDGNGGMGGWRW